MKMKTFSSSKGQFSLEFSVLAVLAMLALLVMATYTIRGINAYFKNTEDAVEQSFSETMLQSQRSQGLDCTTCRAEPDAACGGSPCQPWEIRHTYTCPEGCAVPPPYCVADKETCCEKEEGLCRNLTYPCQNGQRAVRVVCSGVAQEWECENDPDDCTVGCLGIPLAPEDYTAWCPGDGPAPADLTNSTTQVTYVEDDPLGCTDERLCEAVCKNPLEPSADGTKCDCPYGYTWNPETEDCELDRVCFQTPERHRTVDQNFDCNAHAPSGQDTRDYVVDNILMKDNENDINENISDYMECCSLPADVTIPSACSWQRCGNNWFEIKFQGTYYITFEATCGDSGSVMTNIDYIHGDPVFRILCCTPATPEHTLQVGNCQWINIHYWTEPWDPLKALEWGTGCDDVLGPDYRAVGLRLGYWYPWGTVKIRQMRCCDFQFTPN